jgi:archaeosortase B (VPXXXP-CTERM-specific)
MTSEPKDTSEAEAEAKGEDAAPPEASETPASRGLFERVRDGLTNPANRFVVLFLIYLGALGYFYPKFSLRYANVMDWMAEATAAAEYYFFSLFTDSISLDGKLVIFGGFAVQIIEECTGLYEVLIFVAAVLAFPTTLVKKAIGIGLGTPILYAINVLRIGFLMGVGRYYPDSFDFMHLYFWQATLILMITSVWLLWIFKVVRYEAAPSHAA